MSSKLDSLVAEGDEQNRPKRLAAQRAKAFLNDNLDWNEDRALQKALEASLVDEAVRSQHSNCFPDSTMSPKQTNSTSSNPVHKSSQLPSSSSSHRKHSKSNKDKNKKPSREITKKSNLVKKSINNDPISSKSNSNNSIRPGPSDNRPNWEDDKMSVSDDVSSPEDEPRIDLQCSGPSSQQDQDKSPKYLENDTIRRTVAAQRKFAVNTVFNMDNLKISDEKQKKIGKKVENQSSSSDSLKKFEFFPNKLIDCRDFITWVCHTDIEDIIEHPTMVEFPRTYKFKDIYPHDYALGKYQDINDSNDEDARSVISSVGTVTITESSDVESVDFDSQQGNKSSPNHSRKSNRKKSMNSSKRKETCLNDDSGGTETRSKTRSDHMASANHSSDENSYVGIKPKSRRAKPTSIVDYLSDDSDDQDSDEQEDEQNQDTESLEPRMTRSLKNKTKQSHNSDDRSKTSSEEIHKRALDYEANIRETMKDIERKYNSKRIENERKSNTDKGMNNLEQPQYTSTSSSSPEDSDVPDRQVHFRSGSSNDDHDSSMAMNSLRRIKTMQQAMLDKSNRDDDIGVSSKRLSSRMSNLPNATSSHVTSFDIRTRASMRRTRSSKFQHQNRNKNNFLFQEYDGRPMACNDLDETIVPPNATPAL